MREQHSSKPNPSVQGHIKSIKGELAKGLTYQSILGVGTDHFS